MVQVKIRIWMLAVIAGLPAGYTPVVMAQVPLTSQSGDNSRSDAVSYPAAFFDRYQPNTALDMVEQLPGFRLDDGGDQRGFGGAAGNVLIDGRRPSTKQDTPSDILDRIPASLVDRIEMIRGAIRDIELQGQVEVVNVLLRDDVPAAVRWQASIARNIDHDAIPIGGSISMSDRWGGIDYNAGVDIERFARGDTGTEDIFDDVGTLTEERFEEGRDKGLESSANLNASTWWGNTLFQINTEIGIENGDERATSLRIPQGEEPHTDIFDDEFEEYQIEVGIDMERILHHNLVGKTILLYTREAEDAASSQRRIDVAGNQTEARLKNSDGVESESIARLELNWAGWPDHTGQINLEGAYNFLDNAEIETEDTGAGPVVVEIPGANIRVEETRGDVMLQDTWSLGSFELEYGVGAEASRLSQSGDEDLIRRFFFLKPRFMLTYSSDQGQQTRFRLVREVSQLDFNDFVSATVFEDNELALGNPNLRPDTTWVSELSHELRFGREGIFRLTGFHHWISDVMDLLPLTDTEEAPGNIGDGRRWGVEIESTMPLDRMGLADARLDIIARWQDSRVVDPVTGADRVLSAGEIDYENFSIFGNDNEYALTIDYRQDFEAAGMAWGWDISIQAERPLFKVNELDISEEGVGLNSFIETTRWLGMKVRLELNNLLDSTESRDRTIFTGARVLSSVARRQLEEGKDGREVVLSLSGSF